MLEANHDFHGCCEQHKLVTDLTVKIWHRSPLTPMISRGPQDEDFQDQEQDGDEDVRERQIFNFLGTPENEEVQDEDRDGDEDVRRRQSLRFFRTSEDEDDLDGDDDADVLRRPVDENKFEVENDEWVFIFY